MSNKREDEVVRGRKSGGVAGRLARPVRSSDITGRKCSNPNRKADEFSESVEKTVASAVWRVRAPVQETPCVSGKGSTVYKHTASSLAKKESRVRVTRPVRIGKQAGTPSEKVHPDSKELSARKQISELPAFSAKIKQTEPPGCISKQPTETISPSPPVKLKKTAEVSRKKSQAKWIQGMQPEYEASTSESTLDSDSYNDCDNHIIWDGSSKPDKIEVCCCLCERDLGVQPSERYNKSEFSFTTILPVVAVLPCGHVFHVDCLYLDELELKAGGEPPCIFCESTMTF